MVQCRLPGQSHLAKRECTNHEAATSYPPEPCRDPDGDPGLRQLPLDLPRRGGNVADAGTPREGAGLGRAAAPGTDSGRNRSRPRGPYGNRSREAGGAGREKPASETGTTNHLFRGKPMKTLITTSSFAAIL